MELLFLFRILALTVRLLHLQRIHLRADTDEGNDNGVHLFKLHIAQLPLLGFDEFQDQLTALTDSLKRLSEVEVLAQLEEFSRNAMLARNLVYQGVRVGHQQSQIGSSEMLLEDVLVEIDHAHLAILQDGEG